MDKLKMTTQTFELPKLLGIVQQVEYELPPRDRCAGGCLYEGVLVAEGCRKGVCIRYRVRVFSRDRKSWATEEDRRVRATVLGGCIPQAVADALWELADRFEVGLWYEYKRAGMWIDLYEVKCGLVINGVRILAPRCDSVYECVERILEDYKREVERMKEPPIVSTCRAEELLKKCPELEAFGVEWVRAWAPHAVDRLIEIAEVMRRYPWMAEAVKKMPPGGLNPHTVEVYVAKDGSVVCLSLGGLTHCAQNGVVKAVKLELEFSRHEVYEGKRREVHRPKGLLAFSAVGKEYVKIL